MQPAEVTCMFVVTTRIYFSQSKINSFNLFQGPYLQNRDFWESILWSQKTKSITSDPKASKMFWCCWRRSTVRSAWYPQWRSVVVKLLYRDEWVLKVRGSCALSTRSWIHTLLCDGSQKLETEDATVSSFAALLGILSAWQWRYSFSPRWKSFNGHLFHSILSLLSSCGGFCRDERSKTPL